MATSTATKGVYTQVIEDVINNVRYDFLNYGGPGHAVLLQLRALWEGKMMQPGGGVITPGYDLNVPYEDYQTPTTDLLFPPTPLQTPLPLSDEPGTAELYNIPTGGSPFTPAEYLSENCEVSDIKPGRPSQFMQPPAPWLNQRPPLEVNVAYDESREEVSMGASHEPTTQEFFKMFSGKRKRNPFISEYINEYIPQQDGSGDAISDDSKFHVTHNGDVLINDNEDADYEPLNENDDDLEDVNQGEDLNTEYLVLAQFDKVDNNKGRWKCTLKDGIMHINKKDILFHKANGQFDFFKKNSVG